MELMAFMSSDGERGLRKRLILASLGVAMAVSAISMIVAYHVASNLGLKAELASLEVRAETLLRQLDGEPDHDRHEILLASDFAASMARIDLGGHDDHAHVVIVARVGDHWHHFGEPMEQMPAADSRAIAAAVNASGAFTLDHHLYLWVKRSTSDDRISIYLSRDAGALEQALSLTAKRLSFTAFLTFWLAVWCALMLSSLILKRIREI